MRLKNGKINMILVAVFLLSMVFQTWHTIQHTKSHQDSNAFKYFSPNIDKSFLFAENFEIESHSECDVCDFVLGYYIAPNAFYLPSATHLTTVSFPFVIPEIPQSFEGCLFTHRGPPIFI